MPYENVLNLIGNTPLVELRAFCKNRKLKSRIFAKAEFFNPAGSVKDRTALFMLNDAEERGLLRRGGAVVEATSGNTGVALAAICAVRGYKLILTMPENVSAERIKLAKFYGAEVVLTSASGGMKEAVEKAEEIAGNTGGFIPGQFINPANVRAHRETTGRELLAELGEIDYFVAGVGSGGTLTGVAEALKTSLPKVEIIAVEPKSSPLLSEGRAGSHSIQGIGANFVPKILRRDLIDEVITVSDGDAADYARVLAREEGLLCGISSGAALRAAELIAGRPAAAGKNTVVLLPDTGERYMSTELFNSR